MRSMWGVLGLSAALLAVAIGAVLVAVGSSSTAVGDLELGDCFDFPAIGETEQAIQVLEQLDLIDCAEPHQAEVVLVGELNPGDDLDYPTDSELFELVDQRCSAAAPLVLPDFGVLPIAPTEDSWSRLNGRFQCLAVPYGGGRTIGTLTVSGSSG